MMAKLGIGGAGGYAAGGVPGAVAGAALMTGAEVGARNAILSDAYQGAMARPSYGSGIEDNVAALARQGTMSAGRTPDEDLPLTPEEEAQLAALRARFGGSQ